MLEGVKYAGESWVPCSNKVSSYCLSLKDVRDCWFSFNLWAMCWEHDWLKSPKNSTCNSFIFALALIFVGSSWRIFLINLSTANSPDFLRFLISCRRFTCSGCNFAGGRQWMFLLTTMFSPWLESFLWRTSSVMQSVKVSKDNRVFSFKRADDTS